jgi:hypothetical protein
VPQALCLSVRCSLQPEVVRCSMSIMLVACCRTWSLLVAEHLQGGCKRIALKVQLVLFLHTLCFTMSACVPVPLGHCSDLLRRSCSDTCSGCALRAGPALSCTFPATALALLPGICRVAVLYYGILFRWVLVLLDDNCVFPMHRMLSMPSRSCTGLWGPARCQRLCLERLLSHAS